MSSSQLYDSLVLGGVIELAGGPNGVPSTNPMCPGAVFKLDPESWDLGDPQPTTDFVATLAVTGERPFGTRTSDRTPEITVNINAPDYLTLAGAEELLLSTIDAQPSGQFTTVWTPRLTQAQINAGQVSLPVVYDCFRAQPSKKKWGGPTGYGNESASGPWSEIVIKFEALPYGRSDTKTQVAFPSPIAAYNAPAPPPQPVVLDNFVTINSPQFTQSQVCVAGPFTAYWDPGNPPFSAPDGANSPLVYGRTFATPVNLTGMTALKYWLGLGSRYYFNHHPRGRTRVQISYQLTDTSGNVLPWSTTTKDLPVSQNPQNPSFSLVSVRIPQTSPAFNMAAVASYQITIINRGPSQLRPRGEFRWVCATLDQLTAYPSTVALGAPSPHGVLYHVNGVEGTHYAPVSIVAQSPPTAGTATVITATGSGFYTVPASTVYVGVPAVIGGGGPGATMTVAGIGGGGGGAELAGELQLPGSAAGVVIPYQVGAGGTAGLVPAAGQPTTFGPVPGQSLVVTANGGLAAATNTATGALGGSGSGDSIEFPGGAGRTASGGLGGGGGSSAGTAAAGNTPVGTFLTLYTSSGSFTVPNGAGPVTLTLWGAGGGGAGGYYGGAGGGGEVIQVTLNLAAGTYPFTIGTAGSGGAAGANGTAGTATTITIGATTYIANGGQGGQAGSFYGAGDGGDGGSGSPGPGEQPGGPGGDGYPYGGGGGSSAAPGQPGNGGNSYGQPGIAPTGGGNGGAGQGTGTSNGQPGVAPGGGGGGGGGPVKAGGAGAGGQLSVAYAGAGAPTSSGATAPGGGGAGGAGAATTGAGSAGSQPGGGGGGGNSAGATELGGNGGNGQITVIPYQNAAFTTLLLHRPGLQSPTNLNPLVPLNGVAPGSTEFPVQAVQQGATQWGFEDGTTDSWTGTLATVANSAAWANTGSRSLLITATGSSGTWGAVSPSGTAGLPVAPGQQVTVTATVKNPNASTTLNDVAVAIAWYTTGGSFISTTIGTSRALTAGMVGTFTLTAAAPATAGYAAAEVLDLETVAASVTMACDDVILGPAVNARFDGTYTVLLVSSSWNTPSAARTLSATVNQYEATGGTKWSTTTTPVSVIPANLTNGTPFVNLGNLTLPAKALPADNTGAYFTVQVTDSNTSDLFYDLILIDNNGQTLLLAEPAGSGYVTYFVDEPDSRFDLGGVYGSQAGRPQAISVTDAVQTWGGGPLTLQPGDNLLLAYSLAGPPAISVEYFARWFQQRLE